jgi:SAM-dependent methyltransferase
MSTPLFIFLLASGSLFAVKLIYALSIIVTLPYSQGAFFVSTSKKRISAVLNAVPMTSNQILIDLGCGDGRVLRMANKKFGIKGIGYELNPLAFLKAKIMCMFIKNIRLKYSNFYKEDISNADIVFCYLFPDVMKPVGEKLKAELKEGAYIISCNFKIPHFSHERILYPEGTLHNDPIYLYRN